MNDDWEAADTVEEKIEILERKILNDQKLKEDFESDIVQLETALETEEIKGSVDMYEAYMSTKNSRKKFVQNLDLRIASYERVLDEVKNAQ
jgi:hypothetical protein